MHKIFELLHLAFRQEDAIYRVGRILNFLTGNGFSVKKLIALFTAFFEMFGCIIFDSPLTPLGQELNLNGYRLVFEDDFNGDSLDLDNWFYRGSGPSRAGFHGRQSDNDRLISRKRRIRPRLVHGKHRS